MYTIDSLEIKGFQNEPVPNTFFLQKDRSKHIAVLFPGMGYTSHMPLLYYSAQIMLQAGADVLQLEYQYNRRKDFMALAGEARKRWLTTDTSSAYKAIVKKGSYTESTVIGKSIGTRAMGHLFTKEQRLERTKAVWLTPVLRSDALREQIKEWGQRSLFVIGTADPHYDDSFLNEIQKATGSEILIIEGADHSMEIEGNLPASLKAMEKIIRTLQKFVIS